MTLRDTYRKLRHNAHRCFLNQQSHKRPAEEWQQIRTRIIKIWNNIFNIH